jgi:NAD-dependent deacetylase
MNCHTRLPFTPQAATIHPYPQCERCGAALKPDVVFFGEGIPMVEMARANEEANKCKVMFIIGTSGVVYPAADIPYRAKSKGAVIVEINVERTPFTSSITDHFLKGTASEILPEILKHL